MSSLKVSSIDLHNINNAKFVEFMADVQKLLPSESVITTAMKSATDLFAELVGKLQDSLTAVRGNSRTARLNEADEKRDRIHSGMIHLLRAYLRCDDPAKVKAAQDLYFIAKQFGLGALRAADNASETSLLESLVAALKLPDNASKIIAIPEFGTWLASLEASMAEFNQVKSEKEAAEEVKVDYTTGEIRKQTTPVYRNIINGIETFATFGGDPAYATFIAKLNAVIAAK